MEQTVTFGVEEEFYWLGGAIPWGSLLQAGSGFTFGQEAHANTIEIISPICHSLTQLASHLRQSRAFLRQEASRYQSELFCGGTHPQLDGMTEPKNIGHYYQQVNDFLGVALTDSLVFGQHLHIGGIPPAEIPGTLNRLRPYLPLLIALSANSSHWRGHDTGLKAARICILDKLPRTGIPPVMPSVPLYRKKITAIQQAGAYQYPKQVLYDARYHLVHGTIEVRALDMQSCDHLAVAVALFTACLVTGLYQKAPYLLDWQMDDEAIIHNRYEAIKHGIAATFLDKTYQQQSACSLLQHLLTHFSAPIKAADEHAFWALQDKLSQNEAQPLCPARQRDPAACLAGEFVVSPSDTTTHTALLNA